MLETLNLTPITQDSFVSMSRRDMESKGWSYKGGLSFIKPKQKVFARPLAPYAISVPTAYVPSFVPPQPVIFAAPEEIVSEMISYAITKPAQDAFERYRSQTVIKGGLLNKLVFDPGPNINEAAQFILSKIYVQNTDEIETVVRRAFFQRAAQYLWDIETVALKHFYFNVLMNLFSYADKFSQQKFELIKQLAPVMDRDRAERFKGDSYWALVLPMMDYQHPIN